MSVASSTLQPILDEMESIKKEIETAKKKEQVLEKKKDAIQEKLHAAMRPVYEVRGKVRTHRSEFSHTVGYFSTFAKAYAVHKSLGKSNVTPDVIVAHAQCDVHYRDNEKLDGPYTDGYCSD